MPGVNSQEAINSYVAFFKEVAWSTYPVSAATGATAMEFLSCSFKAEIEKKKLDTIGKRGFTKQVPLSKSVAGTLEGYLHPHESVLPIAVALGGGIVSSAATTGVYVHSVSAAQNTFTSPSSLSFNMKKGETPFAFVGGKVDKLTITAEIDEAVKVSYDMIFKDNTTTVTDIQTSLSISTVLPFTFVQGVFRYANTEANAATTTSEEPIQGFELSVMNNLVGEGDARQLGTNLLGVLPATRREIEFKASQRFDTLTTYNRFLQNTVGSIELKFTGETITTGSAYLMTIRLPKVFSKNADPEIGGADEIIKTEIEYDVVYDTTSSAGRDIGITFQNDVASY